MTSGIDHCQHHWHFQHSLLLHRLPVTLTRHTPCTRSGAAGRRIPMPRQYSWSHWSQTLQSGQQSCPGYPQATKSTSPAFNECSRLHCGRRTKTTAHIKPSKATPSHTSWCGTEHADMNRRAFLMVQDSTLVARVSAVAFGLRCKARTRFHPMDIIVQTDNMPSCSWAWWPPVPPTCVSSATMK